MMESSIIIGEGGVVSIDNGTLNCIVDKINPETKKVTLRFVSKEFVPCKYDPIKITIK